MDVLLIFDTTLLLLILMLLYLSLRVIKLRHSEKVAYGLGEKTSREFLAANTAQSNFCQYTPFALIVLIVLMLQGLSTWLMALMCLLWLAGRVIHAYGVLIAEQRQPPSYRWRTLGMQLTFAFFLIGVAFLFLVHWF
jgi:uncharacterized membrane protein YecN with MAPEG domain